MQYKPPLKIGFVDYFPVFDSFFIDVFSSKYSVIRDNISPNYLMFCDETFGNRNKEYDGGKIIKIFFTGENRRCWNYECHFALTFDHFDTHNHFRFPLYVIENWVNINKIQLPDIRNIKREETVKNKNSFCSFIASNGSCQERNNIFNFISSYKKIDSAGALFNNTGNILPRNGIEAQKTKYDFIKTRKFNLCYENGSWPGYVTEKIFHALYMNTIPIYWGSPTVEMDFNPRAFISRHDFKSDNEMLEYIKYVDNNDTIYNQMLSEPILNSRNKNLDYENFLEWFHINVYRG